MSVISETLRTSMEENDNIRDFGLTTPEDIQRYDDIQYGEDKKWQVLDVYRPKSEKGKKLPVIVSVHGGGWVYGDKERYQYYCMSLAQRGFAVVNFTYRLAPRYKYPAPLEDTNLVFTWILGHGDEYGFDTEHIFAAGDSAGGHCLGLYTCICTNQEYASQYDFSVPEGFVPAAVALNSGVYDVIQETRTASQSSTKGLLGEYLPGKGTEEELQLISTVYHVTKNFPPVFLMTSVDDFLKSQAPVMAQRLMECDVPFVYRLYGDKERRLGHVFHCDMRTEDARECNDEECQFFKSFCKG